MGIVTRHTLVANIVIDLTEEEARALYELASYSAEDTVATIAKENPTLGRDHGPALVRFLERLRQDMGHELDRIKQARAVFTGHAVAVPK